LVISQKISVFVATSKNNNKMTHQFNTLVSDDDIDWEVIDPKVRRKVMAYNDKLMLVKVDFQTGGIGQTHHHPHLQMSYVASGIFETTIADQTKTLRAGDVYFVPENAVHGVVCLEAGLLVDVFSPMREDLLC
jgi:quercetin dioxygenase-like cupin family protein